MLSSDAFALNKLSDQPEQTRESVNGVPYTVVTWTSALSAVKAGDYPLNLDLPVMVRVQERAKRRQRSARSVCGFLRREFAVRRVAVRRFVLRGFLRRHDREADDAAHRWRRRENQGAARAGPSRRVFRRGREIRRDQRSLGHTGSTGDPLTLKISITGRGNFDRVTNRRLPASAAVEALQSQCPTSSPPTAPATPAGRNLSSPSCGESQRAGNSRGALPAISIPRRPSSSSTTPSCAACLAPFDYDFSELQGLTTCVAPFTDATCNHITACLVDCTDKSCAMCANPGALQQCQNQVPNSVCSELYYQDAQCIQNAFFGPGFFCNPGQGSGFFGDWLAAGSARTTAGARSSSTPARARASSGGGGG